MAKKYVLGPNAARKLAGLLRGKGEVSRRAGVASELAFDSEYVAPFTVQWAQSADDGAGAWIIWLPSGSLVYVAGRPVDIRGPLTAVGGDYPSGWYILDALAASDTSGSVYIVAHKSSSSGLPTAAFSATPGSPGLGVWSVLVATVSGRMAMQSLTSAIAFGDDGLADDRSCFCIVERYSDPGQGGERTLEHSFGNRYFRIGNLVRECYDAPAIETMMTAGNTVAALQIVYTSSGSGGMYAATIVGFADVAAMIAATADRTQQIIPLYKFSTSSSGGATSIEVDIDFRNAPASQEFELPIV